MPTRRNALVLTSGVALAAAAGCARGSSDYEGEAARLRAALGPDPAPTELVRFASLAANGHNTQPWRFALTAAGMRVAADFTRRTPVVDPDDHHLFVSLGCAAENLTIAARARGQASAESYYGEGVDIAFAGAAPVEDDLFAAIPLRQSTRAEYDGRAISADVLHQLEAAARAEGVGVQLITERARLDAVRDFVIAGNSAQMDDPAFVAELRDWIRFSPETALKRRDGLYAASSGNPALPDWIGRAGFGLVFTKDAENDKYARQMASSAGVAVFVGDKADAEHWMRVGRSFQRFALKATALGLRHAHVNQPVEAAAVRAEFAQWLGAPDARPDLVIRFGYGPTLPMSLRRPAPQVFAAAPSP